MKGLKMFKLRGNDKELYDIWCEAQKVKDVDPTTFSDGSWRDNPDKIDPRKIRYFYEVCNETARQISILEGYYEANRRNTDGDKFKKLISIENIKFFDTGIPDSVFFLRGVFNKTDNDKVETFTNTFYKADHEYVLNCIKKYKITYERCEEYTNEIHEAFSEDFYNFVKNKLNENAEKNKDNINFKIFKRLKSDYFMIKLIFYKIFEEDIWSYTDEDVKTFLKGKYEIEHLWNAHSNNIFDLSSVILLPATIHKKKHNKWGKLAFAFIKHQIENNKKLIKDKNSKGDPRKYYDTFKSIYDMSNSKEKYLSAINIINKTFDSNYSNNLINDIKNYFGGKCSVK